MVRRSPKSRAHRGGLRGLPPDFEMTCPCGRTVTFGSVKNGKTPAAFHEMPQCEDFTKRELTDYVHWLSTTRAGLAEAAIGRGELPEMFESMKGTEDMAPMIPGLLAAKTMACETCGEPATFVEGSLVDDCACLEDDGKPEGAHIVRRCPTGHDNISHVVGGVMEGEWENVAGKDESILRARMDPKTSKMLDQVAKERGVSRDDVARELIMEVAGKRKCVRCDHRLSRHALASDSKISGRCLECECPGFLGMNEAPTIGGREVILGPRAEKVVTKITRLVGNAATVEEMNREVMRRILPQLVCGNCGHSIMLHIDPDTGVVAQVEDAPCSSPNCDCKETAFDSGIADKAMGGIDAEDVARTLRTRHQLKEIGEQPGFDSVAKRLEGASEGVKAKFVEAMDAVRDRNQLGDGTIGGLTIDQAKARTGRRSPFEAYLWRPGYRKAAQLFRESLDLEEISRRDFDRVLDSAALGSFLRGSEDDRIAHGGSTESYLFAQILSIMRLLWAGEREFRLSPQIAESLLLTEVKGVSFSDLHLPFESFLVRFPPGLIDLSDDSGRVYPMISAIVSEWDVSELFWDGGSKDHTRRGLTIFGMGTWNESSQKPLDTTSLGWISDLKGDGEVASHCIESHGLWSLQALEEIRFKEGRPSNQVNTQAIKLATRLILNTCLYVSLPNSDVVLEGQETLNRLRENARKHPKDSHKGKRAREELKAEEGKPQIRKVGWSIRVPTAVREAAAHERSAKGRAFTAQWLVRGHWRWQAFGERGDRAPSHVHGIACLILDKDGGGSTAFCKATLGHVKRIWIQPYHCRRDLGERLKPAPYRVA